MDIATRLIAFKELTGLTNSQFADKAGIPRPTLSQFLNGRNKRLSDDLTAKLHIAFPSLNVMWLLFGEGDMLTNSNIEFSASKNDGVFQNIEQQTADDEPNTSTNLIPESCADSEPIQKKESKPFLQYGRNESTQAFPQEQTQPLNSAPQVPTDPTKQIQSIMVFYSDNSFEIFTPSR